MSYLGRVRAAVGTAQARRGVRWAAQAVAVGSAALALAACGSSANAHGTSAAGAGSSPSAAAKTVNVDLIGKTDAASGQPGTFTAKDGWPAFAPSDINVPAGATVVLTIKEYDDAATALPAASPYNAVQGGTETVNGTAVTSVGNDQIAHTLTIPSLGINIPIAKAPTDGVSTIVFTFKAPAAGSYDWRCFTPCGGDPNGMGGAMETKGWMQGHLVVS